MEETPTWLSASKCMYAWLLVHSHTHTPFPCNVDTHACVLYTHTLGLKKKKGKDNIAPSILVLTFKESNLLLIKVKQWTKMNLSTNEAQAKWWRRGRIGELDFTTQQALATLFSRRDLIITFCSSGRHRGRYFRVNSRVSPTEEHPRGILWSVPKTQHMAPFKPPSCSFSRYVCGWKLYLEFKNHLAGL